MGGKCFLGVKLQFKCLCVGAEPLVFALEPDVSLDKGLEPSDVTV